MMFLFVVEAAGRSLGFDAWLRRDVPAVRDGKGLVGWFLQRGGLAIISCERRAHDGTGSCSDACYGAWRDLRLRDWHRQFGSARRSGKGVSFTAAPGGANRQPEPLC